MDWIEVFLLLAGFALGVGSCWLWLDLLRRRKEERDAGWHRLFAAVRNSPRLPYTVTIPKKRKR